MSDITDEMIEEAFRFIKEPITIDKKFYKDVSCNDEELIRQYDFVVVKNGIAYSATRARLEAEHDYISAAQCFANPGEKVTVISYEGESQEEKEAREECNKNIMRCYEIIYSRAGESWYHRNKPACSMIF